MTAPSADRITFCLQALKEESEHWAAAAEAFRRNGQFVAEKMTLSRTRMGIFLPAYTTYREACEAIAQAYAGADIEMRAISDTLAAIRRTYAEEEAANIHAIKGMW